VKQRKKTKKGRVPREKGSLAKRAHPLMSDGTSQDRLGEGSGETKKKEAFKTVISKTYGKGKSAHLLPSKGVWKGNPDCPLVST